MDLPASSSSVSVQSPYFTKQKKVTNHPGPAVRHYLQQCCSCAKRLRDFMLLTEPLAKCACPGSTMLSKAFS